jgi:hypothetical protein
VLKVLNSWVDVCCPIEWSTLPPDVPHASAIISKRYFLSFSSLPLCESEPGITPFEKAT